MNDRAKTHVIGALGVAAAALLLAMPKPADAMIVDGGFEGAGRTSQGQVVAISTAPLGGSAKGIIIVNSKVVRLTCTAFRGLASSPSQTISRPIARVGGTLYAKGTAADGSRYLVKAVDNGPGGGADEIGIILIDGHQRLVGPCGAGNVRTQPLRGGQFVSGQVG